MRILVSQNFMRYLILFSIIVFIFVGFLGLGHFDMRMEADGQMKSNCLFVFGTMSICQMNPFEHISAWQNMFTVVNLRGTIDGFALLALAFLILFLLQRLRFVIRAFLMIKSSLLFQHEPFLITSPLQKAYSNGILNPKSF